MKCAFYNRLTRIVCLITIANSVGVPPRSWAAGQLFGWGSGGDLQLSMPPGLTDIVAAATTDYQSLALRTDGTVVGWALHPAAEIPVPAGLSNVVSICAGSGEYDGNFLALKIDGTVAAWGDNTYGQTNIPVNLSNVVSIACGGGHNLALRNNRTVVGWGDNSYGQVSIPWGLSNVVAIAAGGSHSLALTGDGRVITWGDNSWGGFWSTNPPPAMEDIVAIAVGGSHGLALRTDRSVVTWGSYIARAFDDHQYWVAATTPDGLTNVVAIAGSYQHSLALTADGHVQAWGVDWFNQTDVPDDLPVAEAIIAGSWNSMAVAGNGPPILRSLLMEPSRNSNGFSVSISSQNGRVYCLDYSDSPEGNNWVGLQLVAGTGGKIKLTDQIPSSSQRFYRVRRW